MSDYRHLQLDRDARGLATVTIDVQGAPLNVFNEALMTEMHDLVGQLERARPKLVVFRSGKASGFMAGADLQHIRKIDSAEQAREVLAAGQQVFERIEKLPCPTVAVIHGPCLGGGLEFALACRYRIARDDGSTKLGLPEVQLGLIPGWGGTQRLPRLVGLRKALELILEAKTLSAAKAKACGLVDRTFPAETFDALVEQFIDERLRGLSMRHRSRGLLDVLLDRSWPGQAIMLEMARKKIGNRVRHYPALSAAMKAINAGLKGPRSAGYAAEREAFVDILFTDAARNLIELFFQREKARKRDTWVEIQGKPRPVKKAAVIGGGTMGAGIAQLLAVQGVPVVIKEINDDLAGAGKTRVEKLTHDAAAKGAMAKAEADAVLGRLTATSAWEPLADADLVVEAVVEKLAVKRDVFSELSRRLAPTAVLATNTSSLSVSQLAEGISEPGRVAGLHFFNPVHRMPLVEVVRGTTTDDASVAVLVDLVRKLGKVPIVVADSPGFLVNRILFPYLDEAVRLVTEGVAVEAVDRAAERFGMPMGPLELLDQVGLDVGADIAGTLSGLSDDPSPTPDRMAAMAQRGWCGKKTDRGFYEYRGGQRGAATPWNGTALVVMDEGMIQQRLIYPMVNEAARCLEANIVPSAWAVDLAMVLGTGFAPFHGGPLRLADHWGIERVVRDLERFRQAYGSRYEPCDLLRSLRAAGHGFYDNVAVGSSAVALDHEEVHR